MVFAIAWHLQTWIPWRRRQVEKAVTHMKVRYKRKPKVHKIYFTLTTFWLHFRWDNCYSKGHFRRTTISFQHPLQLIQDTQKPVGRLCLLPRVCESWVWEIPSSDTDRRPIQMLNLYNKSPLTRRFRNTFATVSKSGNRRKDDCTRFERFLNFRKDAMWVQQLSSSFFFNHHQFALSILTNSLSQIKFHCSHTGLAVNGTTHDFVHPKNISARCAINVGIREIFAVLQTSNLLITKLLVSLLTKHIKKKWISGENHIQCLLLSK